MMQQNIPLVYKIILKRLWKKSEFGRLGMAQTKNILSHDCRVGKENTAIVLEDLRDRGYIELIHCKFVVLKTPLNNLI